MLASIRWASQSYMSCKFVKMLYYLYITATNETQKVTGVVIGTACGLVFLALTFLAICNSRRLSLMHFRRRNYDIQSNYGSDAIQEKAPPSYDDGMYENLTLKPAWFRFFSVFNWTVNTNDWTAYEILVIDIVISAGVEIGKTKNC